MPVINDDIFDALNIGIEKESLRVLNQKISQVSHNTELFGSALTNQFITTDFSESQMEFVTPPLKTNAEALNFLDSIHLNVSKKIDEEILWPLSMPPFIECDSNIPIAYYGQSEAAMLKRIYRLGLSNRYGRQMQAISGIHYNFSIDDKMLRYLSSDDSLIDRELKDSLYLSAIRNIARLNWLLLYLFGASPFVSKSILEKENKNFKQLDNHTYYLPYATSLRMSDIGYQNTKQKELQISLNKLSEYIDQLKTATNTISNEFSKIDSKKGFSLFQLSPNILQIEDEYYSSSRPKSSYNSEDRMLKKLQEYGVDYIELRSIDLNPFKPCGIGLRNLLFLELFLIYCLQKDSAELNDYETKEIRNNDLLVSKEGRRPGLMITKSKNKISVKDWGLEILDEMEELISESNIKKDLFYESLSESRKMLQDPNLTPSSEVFSQVIDSNISYEEFGKNLGESHKKQYLNSFDKKSDNERVIEKEIERSKIESEKLKNTSEESFKKYLQNYLNNKEDKHP